MKRVLILLIGLSVAMTAMSQMKPRPDAFPPVPETLDAKAVNMASTVEEMASWNRYPTYETYLAMMVRWANDYPQLCHVDTIGTSVQGRLILSMYIEPQTDDDLYRPEFFYSSTIHGDEVTGYVMMLRLIDTLLSSYGTSPRLTQLVNSTRISINPLSNPDGTYYGGNNSVQWSRRYNADGIDLNRVYPDPFASSAKSQPVENQAMIDYLTAHRFRLSANLHGGAEVLNYPWDCFTSAENPHPQSEWWEDVCQRFIDTMRLYNDNHFNDVIPSGYIAGGDWYVIHGGRQDYVNYYHDCLEMTMEVSSNKTLSSNRLPEYWGFLAESLIGYIEDIHTIPGLAVIDDSHPSTLVSPLSVYPNPATEAVVVDGLTQGSLLEVFDVTGRCVATDVVSGPKHLLSVGGLPRGVYILRSGARAARVVKR